MKKLWFIAIILLFSTLFMGCNFRTDNNNAQFLRIHIRANSNLEVDQQVKYKIRDKVIDYITPLIASCDSKQQMESVISCNFSNINNLCDTILKANGFSYTAHSKLNNEFFPTRSYGELTLEEGFYDAVIIELGAAQGDNWWCVVYPPLCFVNAKPANDNNFRYKSKIVELIHKFFK